VQHTVFAKSSLVCALIHVPALAFVNVCGPAVSDNSVMVASPLTWRCLLPPSWWFGVAVMTLGLPVTCGREPINIFWNTSNTLFAAGTPPTIEVNRDTGPWQFDQVNLICPSGPDNTEKHIIYSVNKEEYEACEVWSDTPKIVAVCDKPKNFLYFTITFRYFTPSPRQLEFKPGETYFFISTSEPSDVHTRRGGACSTHNMKMQFRIGDSRPKTAAPLPRDLLNLSMPATAFWSKYWRSRVPDTRDRYATSGSQHDDLNSGIYEHDLAALERLPLTSSAVRSALSGILARNVVLSTASLLLFLNHLV